MHRRCARRIGEALIQQQRAIVRSMPRKADKLLMSEDRKSKRQGQAGILTHIPSRGTEASNHPYTAVFFETHANGKLYNALCSNNWSRTVMTTRKTGNVS